MSDEPTRNEPQSDLEDLTPVVFYITEARSVGLTHAEIAAELGQVGWRPESIKLAFLKALRVPIPQIFAQDSPAAPVQPRGPIIEVKNLTKRYGDFTAVDSISFEVHPGETFGILGPNGAGKTTTLEMIEGLKAITDGSATLDGKDVAKETREVKQVIGVQLQSSSFFEELNLVELLHTFAAMYERRVDATQLLEEVQLTEKAKSTIKELSGGQKQRFSIAVGLVNEPKVLFLDEPTTGLDPQARRNLWDLVRKIKARGTTIVLTTHYMEEAEILCDRIAIMDHARIVALDTTQNLLHSVGTTVSIEFKSDTHIDTPLLEAIPGVQSVLADDGSYVLSTTHPRETLDELFAASRRHSFSIDQLTMKRATLEDVFLKLTGHQLRD